MLCPFKIISNADLVPIQFNALYSIHSSVIMKSKGEIFWSRSWLYCVTVGLRPGFIELCMWSAVPWALHAIRVVAKERGWVLYSETTGTLQLCCTKRGINLWARNLTVPGVVLCVLCLHLPGSCHRLMQNDDILWDWTQMLHFYMVFHYCVTLWAFVCQLQVINF